MNELKYYEIDCPACNTTVGRAISEDYVAALRLRLDKAQEALEQYADRDNWNKNGFAWLPIILGWKIAQQALAEIGGENG